MKMRALQMSAALVLGVAAAFVVACGSSSGKIPASDASRLDSALDRVAADTRAGDCDAAEQAVVRAQGVAVNLPNSVDQQLRARVEAGIANLKDRVPVQCQQAQSTSSPPPAATQTQTDTQTTDTTDTTDTSTTDTSKTDTSTTDTSTTDTSTTDTTPTTGTGTGTTTTGTGTTTTTPPAGNGGGTGGTAPGAGG
jgi:hypothetical protein